MPKSTLEQIADIKAEYEKKLAALQDGAKAELLVKIKAKRKELAELESEYEELTGKAAKISGGGKQKRFKTTIEDIKASIKAGNTNAAAISRHLGVSKAQVAQKIKSDGKKAGIGTNGEKRVNFAYVLK